MIIFLLSWGTQHVDLFLNNVHNRHRNIKLTVDHEANGQLSFLDVNVTRYYYGFSIEVYRKETFTRLGLNYCFFLQRFYKVNTMKTLDSELLTCFFIHKLSILKLLNLELTLQILVTPYIFLILLQNVS